MNTSCSLADANSIALYDGPRRRRSRFSNRFYIGGVAGGHHDHRHLDRSVASRRAGGARGGAKGTMRQQSQAARLGPAELPRNDGTDFRWAPRIRTPPIGRISPPDNHGSFLVALLPYLEQQALYDACNFTDEHRLLQHDRQASTSTNTRSRRLRCPSDDVTKTGTATRSIGRMPVRPKDRIAP